MNRPRWWMCLWIFCLMPLLSACTQNATTQQQLPLHSFSGPITLSGTLEVGESEYGIVFHSADGVTGKVSFTFPDSMAGYIFEKADDGYYVSYEDLRIPLRQGTSPGGAGLLFSILSPDVANMQISKEKANGIDLTVYTLALSADGEMRIYTKTSDGTPLRVAFDTTLGSGIFHINEVKFE